MSAWGRGGARWPSSTGRDQLSSGGAKGTRTQTYPSCGVSKTMREDDGGAVPLSSLLRSVKAARNHDKPTFEQAQVLPHDNSAASGSFLPSHLRLVVGYPGAPQTKPQASPPGISRIDTRPSLPRPCIAGHGVRDVAVGAAIHTGRGGVQMSKIH
ncbi:uncharacterized protein LOC120674280 isoform X2 [Panicum virgatum]|uniref:uncharacterized protein LOC120674280 isoform X2 n=1 Tax=Panicum virgatum TaxID=38727 RepID=UPI0019D68502|nr:uncharacterized protein LOC120674280 isoform X2 [Panicum virgatum]